MEALFSTALASVEAWLMLICVVVFLGVYLLDVVALAERVMMVLRPPKKHITEEANPTEESSSINDSQTQTTEEVVIESPMLEEITPEEIQAHEEEKAEEEQELIAHQEEASELEEEVREAISENPEAVIENIDKIVEEHLESTDTIESPTVEENQSDSTEEVLAGEENTNDEVIEESVDQELIVEPVASDTPSELDSSTVESAEESKIEEDIIESTEPRYEEISETEDEIVESKEEPLEDSGVLENSEGTELEEPISTTAEEVLEEGAPTEKIDASLIADTEPVNPKPIGETIETAESEIEKTEVIETVESREKQERERNTERLYAITNEVKTLIARGNTLDARALIIQGLALEKNHRELNVILGSLYESDRQFQKAEYVYKDLALIYPEDIEILEKLANILIIEKRYDIALEIYRKIVSLSGETEGSLYIMTHLSHELGHNEDLYAYAKRYQKSWPNNPEILALLAEAEIALGERQAAIQTLIKLKNLTPYNAEIMETIAKLTMEEELAGNFGGEKI